MTYDQYASWSLELGSSLEFDIRFRIYQRLRGVAQLVARTAGGREVAGSSPVTPTKELIMKMDSKSKEHSYQLRGLT
jgi:hypothetical protein